MNLGIIKVLLRTRVGAALLDPDDAVCHARSHLRLAKAPEDGRYPRTGPQTVVSRPGSRLETKWPLPLFPRHWKRLHSRQRLLCASLSSLQTVMHIYKPLDRSVWIRTTPLNASSAGLSNQRPPLQAHRRDWIHERN